MSKQKTPDEKLRSYRSDKGNLRRAAVRLPNVPVVPKRTNANNQFR